MNLMQTVCTVLLVMMFSIQANAIAEPVKTTGVIIGQLLLKNGKPLDGGKVHFFRHGSGPPPSQILYWRTPDEIGSIDHEGRFSVNLPEGKYYISAIKKTSINEMGPPVAGDLVYPESRKELKSEFQTFLVKNGQKTDIGTIAEVVTFKKHTNMANAQITSIEGIIVDPSGNPVHSSIVFAFTSEDLIGKPLYVSERTDKDGRYTLKVPEGGNYFLKSRTSLKGGQPVLGEFIGFYGKGSPKPVRIKTGETVTGVKISAKALSNIDIKTGKSESLIRKPSGFGAFQKTAPLKREK